MDHSIRVAILDLYNKHPNQGMRGIRSLLYLESLQTEVPVRWHIFDVRHDVKLPDDSYDIYISSGGPGDPGASGELWEKKYFALMDKIRNHNLKNTDRKKYVFLICHSFELMCRHWQLGEVNKRKSPSFGVFPIHKTAAGEKENLFKNLGNPFYATDSREYQVIAPNHAIIKRDGFKILATEKERPHIPLERAIMSVRFSDEIIGTQFHPEADPHGMIRYFTQADKKESIIKNYGEEKYYKMIDMLDDPDKIILTQKTILPTFLKSSFEKILATELV
ncbi:MAG: GMP synthase [Chitinophagales bacterium]|nr:GMP synthase [Chitinophagales bacterium]